MKKSKFRINAFSVIMFVILTLYSLTLIYLLAWAFLCSFKSKSEFNMFPLSFPKEFHFSNYTNIFRDLNVPITKVGVGQRNIYLPELFLYSILYSLGGTLVYILTRAMVAYACSRYKFRLSGIIYTTNILVMIIPIVGRLPGELQLMRQIGFYDNLLALCLMKGSFSGMDFLLLYSTFASIPKEYTEAATIDGASHTMIMWTIIFPMAMQIMFILALTQFIALWNDWSVTVTYMPSYPVAAYALYTFQNSNLPEIVLGGIPYIFCACTVVMLPILILFFVFRKQILGEISFGGIKG